MTGGDGNSCRYLVLAYLGLNVSFTETFHLVGLFASLSAPVCFPAAYFVISKFDCLSATIRLEPNPRSSRPWNLSWVLTPPEVFILDRLGLPPMFYRSTGMIHFEPFLVSTLSILPCFCDFSLRLPSVPAFSP